MKQKTQHYFTEVSRPDILEVGQPVVDGDAVIGFVYETAMNRAEIMLWIPMTFEFLDHMENVSEEVENIYDKFSIAIVKATCEVKETWKELLKKQ
jgi:hypothetical protein